MKNITFIIVTWNNEDCIIQCMESIYKYSNNFKVIIVDNHSSDNTVRVLLEKKYTNCKVCALEKNLGFAEANNYALRYVDTQYICYLNPDTILIEDIVEPSIQILEKNCNVGLVGCKLLNKDYTLQPSTFNFLNQYQVYSEAFRLGKLFPNFIRETFFPNNSKCKNNKYVDWVIGAEMILSTKDAKKVDGFSTEYYMYAEDMDICKKINKYLNKKTYYLADIRLIHIGGVSEAKNFNYSKLEKVIRNKITFVNKFYGIESAIKTSKALINSYKIRMKLIKIFYWFDNNKRKLYIDKMKNGLEISKKESQRIRSEK